MLADYREITRIEPSAVLHHIPTQIKDHAFGMTLNPVEVRSLLLIEVRSSEVRSLLLAEPPCHQSISVPRAGGWVPCPSSHRLLDGQMLATAPSLADAARARLARPCPRLIRLTFTPKPLLIAIDRCLLRALASREPCSMPQSLRG